MDTGYLEPFLHRIGQLKNIKRAGWVREGIPDPESVADHSYRVSVMVMILGDALDMDTMSAMKMALVHDLPEVLCGDITPHDNISREEKSRKEEDAVKELFKDVPGGEEYIDLWTEYDMGESPDAVLVRDVDKLEMALQAQEYQKAHPDIDMSEFMDDVRSQIRTPGLVEMLGDFF